jgi:P27 family predicted phage terminase small subunit
LGANRSRAGRPGKPKEAKILAGTFRKDREPKAEEEFAPESGVPNCPSWLGEVAREEWALLVADPAVQALLTKVDRIALAAWADALATWRLASKALDEAGSLTMIFTGKGGSEYEQQRPEVSIVHQARKQVMDFAREFGLTPSSRRKVAGPPAKKPAGDAWDNL